MARDFYADRARVARFATDFGWRRLCVRAMRHPLVRWFTPPVSVPSRLLFAPHDLRTGDPTRAHEFYAGRFAFAGKVVTTDGASPFEMDPPSREWAEELMSFSWLRHLQAAGTPIARANARALVGDWIAARAHLDPAAAAPDVAARRVISWLTQAPLILQSADAIFHRRFLRSLAAQVRYVRSVQRYARDGRPRLLCALALCFAGLCMADQPRLLRSGQRRLVEELERQVLADGGHVGRDPGALIELLLDLLPLRQSFAVRHLPPPPALLNAIDRMMPMLRFFRHVDGSFAHFNGMGPTPADWLATVLAYDDARGRPLSNAPYSGYQRMEAGGTVLIADTGAPPPIPVSHEAHAGCLSFELSSGRNRLVVNCGMPATGREGWRATARQTAAHSTAVIEEASSCRFVAGGLMKRICGTPVLEGPADLRIDRALRGGADVLLASHDGYARRFGVVHQRSWRLSPDGGRLDGEDLFRVAQGEEFASDQHEGYAIRFHLHPLVRPARAADGHTVLLHLPDGDDWAFTAPEAAVSIEESIMLAANGGARRTEQLVIVGHARQTPRVSWTFMRVQGLTG
ncbi:heparinase II/III family protein [Ancylobacter sp. A5.8]|uniref:heparinase II/III family protein n=1 Tax=Ancylobacter gelatini TaxID=2919920 RepID=UPI001F4DA22B|nr:heparinase II/III family protein [Ancylobacter gelatini]MCJ8144861.1 heparinase II/III family protein [Ancylobacter gelatini]